VEEEASTGLEVSLGREKCIKQFVGNAGLNVKCHSSQQKASQYFAEIATERKIHDFSLEEKWKEK